MKSDETKKDLIAELKKIYYNKDFVIGIMSAATHIEDQKTILDFIKKGDEVTVENLIVLAVHLRQQRLGVNQRGV